MTDITANQREILQHTKWRAANRVYCGATEDPDMQALCDAGLMEALGRKPWLPETDAYFTITDAGIRWLAITPDNPQSPA
jgi:hypothetical protein